MRFLTLLLFISVVLDARQGVLMPTQQSANLPTHTITGSVVNSFTGEPVPHARVRAQTARGPLFAFSGPDGRFSIDEVPEGHWMITAQRPGFETPDVQPDVGSQEKLYRTIGGTSNDFKLELTPDGGVTGVVNDSDGNPIAGIQVQALTESINQGRKQYLPSRGMETDDTGTYRINNLRAGSILIRTSAHPRLTSRFSPAAEAYPEFYYPNTPDIESAQSIVIKPGQEARADFNLTAAPVYSVSGTITGLPFNGRPTLVKPGEDGTQSGLSAMQYDPRTGHFVIHMVPARHEYIPLFLRWCCRRSI
jgi:hypothetical protein